MELGRRHDEASTSAIGVAIAAATFASAFIVAQLMVAEPEGIDGRGVILDAQASTALDLIVSDPGLTLSGRAWPTDADNLTRFGLAMDGKPNFLDYTTIKALRNGSLSQAKNGHPDYPEVRAALGIRDADIHLRSYPVIPGVEDPRWTKEAHGRLAYFAHYSGASAPAALTVTTTTTATDLNITLTVKNEALRDAIFLASVSIGNQTTGTTVAIEDRHTRLLAPGETQQLYVEFPRLSAWASGTHAVKIEIADPYGNQAVDTSGNLLGPFWVAATPPSGGSNAYGVLVSAANLYYQSGDEVEFVADHYKGTGGHMSSDQAARFVLVGPNGAEWVNQSISLPKQSNSVYTFTCTNCTAQGTYRATVWGNGMTQKATDRAYVHATEIFTEKSSLDAIAVKEIGLLGDLVKNFNPTRYDPVSNPQGDVFGDDSNGPNELADVIGRYSYLVVGSEVTQTALNAAATKYAISDWVQAGGNLVVLGTFSQQSRWLEPIYHAAQVTASGGISAPDPTHPILTAPERLQYDRYLDRARAWNIKADQPFTHVLSRGSDGINSRDDTLAVSNPGALSNGTVVLTSYMPGGLTAPQDDVEAKKFLHNLLSQGYTMLFLDYGPAIPAGVQVGSDSRLVAVPHPNVPGAVVEVRLVLYVFG